MVAANLSQMVPVEESCKADEPKIIFIVKDETTNDWQNSRSVINLPESTSVDQLINEVAKNFHYCPSSFRLTWESMVGTEVELSDAGDGNKTFPEMGFYQGRRNTICVKDKDGLQPRRMDGTMGEAFAFPSPVAVGANSPADDQPVFGPLTQAQSGRRHAVDQGDTSTNSGVPLVADSSTSPSHPSSSSSDFTYSYSLSKSDTGYVGLVNQAMTCYLNSLLQTLFMTPEFRNAVYRWDYDGSMEEEILSKSIPFQLQRLFLALQTSKKRAVETTDITKSFGWDSSEAWQQHDIQELCRILFDALETKWRKTDQRDVINQLYQGKMKDYVKCLQCGYESARMDCFLDIPLTLRPFGSSLSYGSVEESLEAFVAAETLDGNNQYFCDKCKKKCDARKGLKFEHFPYVLTMQMKRFDFDYNTLQRIKLNERMTFPEILNLNRFISDDESLWKTKREPEKEGEYPRGWNRPAPSSIPASSSSSTVTPAVNRQHGQQNSQSLTSAPTSSSSSSPSSTAAASASVVAESDDVPSGSHPPIAPPLPPGGLRIPGGGSFKSRIKTECASPMADEDEGIELESTNSSSSPSSSMASSSSSSCNADLESGPYVYELFSVMIHSGSANGGHYYAYIKSFAETQWYSFNDQNVQKITPEEVFKTFGGYPTRSYHYQSSANAYMLMYRQIRPENADVISESNFPPHIKDIMKRERDKEEEERKQREIDRCMCKIKLFCLKPLTKSLTDYRFEIHKDKTLKEATEDAYALCGLYDDSVALEDVRLVKYDDYHESFERSYNEVESNDTMEKILHGVKSSYSFDLFLEIKPPYASFQTYKPGGTTIKVHLVDLDQHHLHPAVNIRAQLSNSIDEFKALAARALNIKFAGDSSSLPPSGASPSTTTHRVIDETVQPVPVPTASSSSSFSSPHEAPSAGVANDDDVVVDDDGEEKLPRLPRVVLKSIHCVFERYTNDLRYLANPMKSLKSEGFFRSNKVFIAYRPNDNSLSDLTKLTRTCDVEEAFKSTRLYSVIDCHNHTIRLQVTLPPQAPNPPPVASFLLQEQPDSSSSSSSFGGGGGVAVAVKAGVAETSSSSSRSQQHHHLLHQQQQQQQASTCSAPSSVLSAAPSCESGYATSTSFSLRLRNHNNSNSNREGDGGIGSGGGVGAADDDKRGGAGDANDALNDDEAARMDTTDSTSPPSSSSFYRDGVEQRQHPHRHHDRVSSTDASSASTSSSSTRTLLAEDDDVVAGGADNGSGTGGVVEGDASTGGAGGGAESAASSMSPRSSIPNSPEDAGTVSPLIESPGGGDSGSPLDHPPAGMSVVGGGKGWSFPETEEDPLEDDCMLPESASGRVSPAGDPSEGEEDADNSPDNSQANAKLESWRTEMSRNWIRDVNSRQMMRIDADDNGGGAGGGGGDGAESDKETHIGTWDSKDLDDFANATREKFSLVNPLAAKKRGVSSSGSVENVAAPSDGTEMWTHSGNVSGTKDWQMASGCASPEMMATSPPAASSASAMSCDSTTSPEADFNSSPDAMAKAHEGKAKAEASSSGTATTAAATATAESGDEDGRRYFKALSLKRANEGAQADSDGSREVDGDDDDLQQSDRPKVLSIEVDKRITLGSFKKRLEPWLGTTADNFKVFRVYPNMQEFESTRLQETLTAFSDDGKMSVKYGRALRKGEYRVKVYHLDLNKPTETPKLLCETVFANEMSVLEAKKVILVEVSQPSPSCDNSLRASVAFLPCDRIRLRKRAWKNPGTIYLDDKLFNADIPIFSNWEVILQVLPEPQVMLQTSFLGVFLRRWRPSQFCLDPIQEAFLYESTLEELLTVISAASDIPVDRISFAKGRGNFPCEVNLLDIESDLEWDPPNVTSLSVWPLYICDDGNVIYFRDKDEQPKELDEAQRSALQQQQQQQQQTETSRTGRSSTQVTFSPRKERPLRIKVYSESDDAPLAAHADAPEKIEEDAPDSSTSPSSIKKTRSSPVDAAFAVSSSSSSTPSFRATDID